MNKLVVLSLLAACGSNAPAPAAPTPTPPPPSESAPPPATASQPNETTALLAQSALSEQYLTGKAVYTKFKCDTCHEPHGAGNPKNPPVIGPEAFPAKAGKISKLRKNITFDTAADVVAFTVKNMPIDKPGTLPEKDAYAVASWMLDESKVQLDAPLDAATAPTVKLR
ncbi:MAG TPA: cytochrome c [Kofleriaceae bacterium]|jgi:cytochrome c